MIQFTTIRHANNKWVLIHHTEWVDHYKREIVAIFETVLDALNSKKYISAPLPATYQTIYSSTYKGYLIHVTRKVVTDTIAGILNIHTRYIGFISFNDSPIYLDYLKSSQNEYIDTDWRSYSDTISNLKWFVKSQLPSLQSCTLS
jgi:hypothetical protein